MPPTSLSIPLEDNAETVIDINISDLVSTFPDVYQVFLQVHPHPRIHLLFASHYVQLNAYHYAYVLLKDGYKLCDTPKYIPTASPIKLKLLIALATFHLKYPTIASNVSFANSEVQALVELSNFTADSHSRLATEYLNLANAIDSRNLELRVVKGSYLYKVGKAEEAEAIWDYVLKEDKENIGALLGKASIKFKISKYQEALTIYQKILKLNPKMMQDIRIPIGVCFSKLGHHSYARSAFESVLQDDLFGDNTRDALSLLAVLDFNKSKNANAKPANGTAVGANNTTPVTPLSVQELEELEKRVNTYIHKALSTKQGHPMIAIQCAERYFLKNNYENAKKMCAMAYNKSTCPYVKADALFLKGKVFQAEENYDEAYARYTEALELNPKSSRIQYGLAQMCIYKGDNAKAIAMFEKIVEHRSTERFAMIKLANLYTTESQTSKKAEILKKLVKILEKTPDLEFDFILDFARCCEDWDLNVSLEYYQKALSILESRHEVIPELVNNIGALYQTLAVQMEESKNKGKSQEYFQKSLEMYLKAMDQVEEISDMERIESCKTSILYNISRVHEYLGNLESATEGYTKLMESHTGYVDAYLRMATLSSPSLAGSAVFSNHPTNAKDEGAIAAKEFIQKALSIDPSSPQSSKLMGQYHLTVGDYKSARNVFTDVTKEKKKDDMFSLCCIGNLNLGFAKSDPKQKEIHLRRSFEFFEKALRIDNKCVPAATGIGIVFAESGKFREAKDVFMQVQEATGTLPYISINLAHVMMELEQYPSAMNIYENILKKYYDNRDPYLLLCLSKVNFIIGKKDKNVEVMEKALNYIQKAIRMLPNDLSLMYNLALLLQQNAVVMNEQPSDARPVDKLRKRLEGLETAKNLFQMLAQKKPDASLLYDPQHASSRAKYCMAIMTVTRKKIHETVVLENQKLERKREIIDALEEKSRLAKLEKERQEEEEERKQKEIERKREELKEKVLEERRKEEEVEGRKKKKRENDDEEDGSKRRKRDKSLKEDDEEDEEEDVGKKKSSKRSSKKKVSDDGEERNEKPGKKGRRGELSAAVIDSDDDLF